MIVRQLKIGSMDNFCYLVGCKQTREAVVIDPGANVKRILSEAERQGLTITHIVSPNSPLCHPPEGYRDDVRERSLRPKSLALHE